MVCGGLEFFQALKQIVFVDVHRVLDRGCDDRPLVGETVVQEPLIASAVIRNLPDRGLGKAFLRYDLEEGLSLLGDEIGVVAAGFDAHHQHG